MRHRPGRTERDLDLADAEGAVVRPEIDRRRKLTHRIDRHAERIRADVAGRVGCSRREDGWPLCVGVPVTALFAAVRAQAAA